MSNLYKFISSKPGSLKEGTLYVADTINGKWLALDWENQPLLKSKFKDQTEVLIRTREASKLLGATALNRPEDVEIDPITGNIFVSLTNNKPKGDYHGSILKIEETNGEFDALTFKASTYKAGGEENFLNFFVTLVNEFKLPIVLIGTNLALPILTKELRQSRRSLGLGSLAWDPLVPDDTWDFFIEELWQYRWLQTDQKLSNELREAFFYETQGIVDLLLKLFIFCQIAAIDEETEEITVELVHQVARKELVLVAGVIQAIRENDKQKLAKFRDIGFRELNEYFVKRIEETSSQAKPIAVEKIQHSAPESDSSVSLVVSMLTTLDIEEELARSVVYKIVEDKPHLDTISLSQEALKILKPDEKKKQTKRKKITEFEDGDLRGLWERAKQNDGQIYDELEASGYISLGIAV